MKWSRFVYYIIYLLTVLDIAFTLFGLQLGIIQEGNPIMNYFICLSTEATAFCVLAYVAIALVFLYKVSEKVKWLNMMLTGLASIKAYVLILHFRWLSVYFGEF
ncbi:MAG: hypothetical protein K0R93_1389 [Anaerosolibacter sp.]|uniref:DUF5658 family protein n=1 Tax=Anaerosolibacter sp. TaxID=1872527 RepID=UPI0026392B21|nr:DUF5658 family protein [Anaerosolibacter sp.]MDF2546491.1 hypothetical protein [Anaerosolibacter sp.]